QFGDRVKRPAIRRHQLGNEADHVVTGRPRLQPARPRVLRGFEFAQRGGDRSRRIVAYLMAVAATIGLDEVQPLILRLEFLRYAVALVAGAGEPALVRDLDHRSP